MDDFEVGKCGDCPRIKHCLEEVMEMKTIAGITIGNALDPGLDEHAPILLDQMSEQMIGPVRNMDGEEILTPHDLVVTIRKSAVLFADHIDDNIETEKAEAGRLIADCPGPLKMRASKAGTQIVVTACLSPSLASGESCEIVHINRTAVK